MLRLAGNDIKAVKAGEPKRRQIHDDFVKIRGSFITYLY
jgi:hypothetical protein